MRVDVRAYVCIDSYTYLCIVVHICVCVCTRAYVMGRRAVFACMWARRQVDAIFCDAAPRTPSYTHTHLCALTHTTRTIKHATCTLTPVPLMQIRKSLKPDGVFMAAMIGGDSLRELRSALALADMERRGGVTPHISPFAHIRDAGNLLGKLHTHAHVGMRGTVSVLLHLFIGACCRMPAVLFSSLTTCLQCSTCMVGDIRPYVHTHVS